MPTDMPRGFSYITGEKRHTLAQNPQFYRDLLEHIRARSGASRLIVTRYVSRSHQWPSLGFPRAWFQISGLEQRLGVGQYIHFSKVHSFKSPSSLALID